MKMLRGVSYKIGNRLSKAPVGRLTKHGKKHTSKKQAVLRSVAILNMYICYNKQYDTYKIPARMYRINRK